MTRWVIDEPRRLAMEETVTQLTVSLMAGRLNVVGTDGPARVEVSRTGRKPLVVTLESGVLTVKNEKVPRWPGVLWWLGHLRRRYRADVSIAVPYDAFGDLRMVSGSVVASGLRAGAALDVTSGKITLLGLDGHVAAKVVSGSIEALGVGGELSLHSISGEITVADSTASRVDAKAISGAVTCDLDNPDGSEIRLETTSGEITVRVREDSDLDVHLHATSGRISSGFWQVEPLGTAGTRTAHGRLGAGTGRLRASAVSGNIALLSRPVDDAGAETHGDAR
jgi:hypothetical protein